MEEKTIIKFALPYVLIPESSVSFDVPYEDNLVVVKIDQKMKNKDDFAEITGWIAGEDAEIGITADQWGLCSYSVVKLIVPKIVDLSNARDISKIVIDKILESYRKISRAYWMRSRLSRYDIITINLEQYVDDELKGSPMSSLSNPLKVEYTYYFGEKIIRQVQKSLIEETSLPYHFELLLDAQDFVVKEDFRKALLEAHLALEVYLHPFLRSNLEKRGLPEDFINYLLHRPEITGRLTDILKFAVGKSFVTINKETKELWDKFSGNKEGINKVRNDLIHGHRETVDGDYAIMAVNTIEKMIIELEDINTILNYSAHVQKVWGPNSFEKHKKALEFIEDIIEIYPKDEHVVKVKAELLYYLGRYEEGLDCYEIIQNMDSKDAKFWSNKASFLNRLSMYDQAVKCCDKSIEIDSRHISPRINKGTALCGLRKYDEALICLDEALEINPESVSALTVKGGVLLELQRNDEAKKCIETSLEIDQDYPGSWYNLAIIFLRNDNNDKAIEFLNKAISLDNTVKETLRKDKDFEKLHEDPRYKELINSELPKDYSK